MFAGLALILVSQLISTFPAFAEDFKVVITNSSAVGCYYMPPCFVPHTVTISPGDTVTWINQDNTTHTVTTGSANSGPVGNFDSGLIAPSKTFTQFFGMNGEFKYYDKVDPWVTGIVVVQQFQKTHAELGWVAGSLQIRNNQGNEIIPQAGQVLTISKDIRNTGQTDAPSILFRLKIDNGTGVLVYDQLTRATIGANLTLPINYTWTPPAAGTYHLFFDANAANTIGDTNENNNQSIENLTITSVPTAKPSTQISNVEKTQVVPEFGQVAAAILGLAVISMVIISPRTKVKTS